MDNKYKQENNNLWQKCKSGNKSAFQEIYYQCINDLFAYGCAILPDEDVVKEQIQELFIYIWDKKDHLNITDIKPYLIKSLKRKLYKYCKGNKNYTLDIDYLEANANELVEDANELVEDPNDIDYHEMEIKRDALHKLIESLPTKQKEIIYLRYFTGLKPHEIADIMEINAQSVYNLLSRSLKNIEKKLTNKNHINE
ncbi:RNA polymerase sigma factor [Aureibacter tunicatorum]|uniref:RNA polymerase sigma factor (Sigma-70 family) n=1 Tax=Aureibacter tunicatorum TaxID=866807 RepID=A0AAE4BSZ6_9BACT|nr:sigma-70 family RNA polymerase sigma factor [Aureibacter tunicatorum]MDR6240296.1 RNA polymerase sigma factor (sigma-70 family) [Aureibacter tunicatorum]BDD05823.1 DNA-directed RNA polymerase sigma-70 factor [Aureibacter tunicatorum]